MFNCLGKSQDKRHTEIQKFLKEEAKEEAQSAKVLLLGAGDTGKTTFCKQLSMLCHGVSPLVPADTRCILPIIRRNAIDATLSTFNWASANLQDWPFPEIKESVETILDGTASYTPFSQEVATAMESLSQDPKYLKILEKVADFLNLPGGLNGTKYFLSKATNFVKDDATPSEDDLLRVRIQTTGIVETKFDYNGYHWTIVDVGGQRSERKKWINCFSNVNCIIFLMALDEYDRALEEDDSENRLIESLKLWKRLTSLEQFQRIPFILFMNKKDIFEEKITRLPLSAVFGDYDGFVSKREELQSQSELEKSLAYIQHQFQNHFSGKAQFYAYPTCALDRDNCKKVFDSTRAYIINQALSYAGIKL